MLNPSAPRPLVRVQGVDQPSNLMRGLQGCNMPGGDYGRGGFAPNSPAPNSNGVMARMAPTANGLPYGPNAVENNCAMWAGGPRPLRSTYIGGVFPAFALGATGAQTFLLTTRSFNFLGFKFMAPDTLMGTGLGLMKLVINGMDYLDVATAVPLEVFNALSDNETQGRIDLAWLQTPNGEASVVVQPVAGGAQDATPIYPVTLQGFALANF